MLVLDKSTWKDIDLVFGESFVEVLRIVRRDCGCAVEMPRLLTISSVMFCKHNIRSADDYHIRDSKAAPRMRNISQLPLQDPLTAIVFSFGVLVCDTNPERQWA